MNESADLQTFVANFNKEKALFLARLEAMKKLPYNLFLDDMRKRSDVTWVELPAGNWRDVKNYNEFVDTITECGLPLFISFDHDLADHHYAIGQESGFSEFDYSKIKEKTGLCCAKWLIDYCIENKLNLPAWETHSMNPCGKENIDGLLKGFRKFQEENAGVPS